MKSKSPYHPDAPWPTMRGDLRNSGRAHSLKWEGGAHQGSGVRRFKTGNGIFSTPVIDTRGNIHVGSADHNFYVFNPHEGKEEWRFKAEEIIDSAACIGKDGSVYFAAGDANIHALDDEGAKRWGFDVLNNRSPGLFSLSTNYWWEANVVLGPDGALYAGNDDFFMYCIEPDGALRWAFRTGLLIWAAAAFGEDGTVYIPSFDMNIYALEPKSGRLIWKTDLGNPLVSSPAIGNDGTIYQGCMDGKLYALNGATGEVKWSVKTGGHIYASAAVAEDGMVYITSTDGSLYAVDAATGEVRWTYFTGDVIRSSPSLGPDPEGKESYLIYFGGGAGLVYAIDPHGAKRWSYNTLVDSAGTEYPNINASPALDRDGLTVATASGDVIWVPYDYYLGEGARGIVCDDRDDFAAEGACWHYVTPGGLIDKNPLDPLEPEGKPRLIQPSQVISLRLILRENAGTVPAQLDPESIRIDSTPSFYHRVEVQSDECTINIIPEEILTPGRDYALRVTALYETEGGSTGKVAGAMPVRTEDKGEGYPLFERQNPAFRITHMAIPQPAIVPSLDQIGIASLSIPFSVVHTDPVERTFVAWGVQRFGETESGDRVGVPQQRSLLYAFSGAMRDDSFIMEARNCFFDITAFPVPLDLFRLSGQLNPDGTVSKGASLLAEFKLPGWGQALKNIMNGSWRGLITAGRWLVAQMKEAGWKQFKEAADATLPFMVNMLRRRIWRHWGLFNHEGKFTGVGTFRMEALSVEKVPPEDVEVLEFIYRPALRRVVAEVDVNRAGNRRESVMGILLVDTRTGRAVPINYNVATSRKTYKDGKEHVELSVPLSVRMRPGRIIAYLMADLCPLRRLDI